MDVLTQLIVWLNTAANALGSFVLAPIAVLPGWASATLVSAATGFLLLVVFKYTSHQRAIKAVRNDIKAHLLALKLFKESAWVALRAQARIFLGAGQLLALAVVPMLVMVLPVCLLLSQLALWYQSRPLQVGEEAVVTMKLHCDAKTAWPKVSLQRTDALETSIGPVRVFSKREICWYIKARQPGYHRMVFLVDGQRIEKELAIGEGAGEDFMRISTERPAWDWSEALMNPAEPPFGPGSPVQSIEIDYPERFSWKICGIDPWLIYWFGVSMLSGLLFRPLFNVSM
jgi:hypothetical protein